VSELGVLLLVAGAVAVAGFSRRRGWPAPLVVVLVGLVVSEIPRMPQVEINPALVLDVFLPPLLYSAAQESSYLSIRRNLRPIALLSVGLVLFTTFVVALASWWLIGPLSIGTAFVLGAVVAPPDAVAATAVGRTLGLPRRMLTILGGESLLNDGTALTLYQVAVAAVVTGTISVATGLGLFVVTAAGGIVVGLLIGKAAIWLLCRLNDGVLENTVSLLVPFVAFAVAQALHTSGVLAVVLAGLTIGHAAPRTLSYAARLQSEAIWRMIDFLLEAVVFAVIGLQLSSVLAQVRGFASTGELVAWGAFVLLVVIVSRLVWVYPATYVPRWIPSVGRRDPAPPVSVPTVIGWAGMRGVVSVAAAVALPLETDAGAAFPQRDLVIYLAFVVVVGTLVIQGFTLPWLIRRLNVTAGDETADLLAEAEAQQRAAAAAVDRLDVLLAQEPDVDEDVVQRLRSRTQGRALTAWERLGGDESPEAPSAAYRRLRRQMLAAERDTFVKLRDAGRLDDEVLRRVHRELDLEEAMLARE
jgi:CPA1 family monovalent cation:H+ antiporter